MKQLAIIKNVGYGCRDIGQPVLFFDTFTSESSAALHILRSQDADSFIKAYNVYDVKNLNGKPVWVEANDGLMRIIEPCILPT